MYLNQLGLKAKAADKRSMVKKLNGNGCERTPPPQAEVTAPEVQLPPKRKTPFRERTSPAGHVVHEEAIYDSLPKPRPCLSEDQVTAIVPFQP